MADNVRDPERRAAEEDFKSELLLRKQKPPYGSVHADFDRYMAETARAIEELRTDDPGQFEEMERGINADVKNFRSSRDKSKN
jgi:hypothetical protein